MILKAKYRHQDDSLTLEEAAEICLRCGVCCVVRGHSCHVMYDNVKFTPRYTYVYDCLGSEDPAGNPNIWLCVSCHKCEEMCPYEVSPVDFIEEMKAVAWERGAAHPVIRGEVEQVLATGYAFPITPSAKRLRDELGLGPLTTGVSGDLMRIAEETSLLRRKTGEGEDP